MLGKHSIPELYAPVHILLLPDCSTFSWWIFVFISFLFLDSFLPLPSPPTPSCFFHFFLKKVLLRYVVKLNLLF